MSEFDAAVLQWLKGCAIEKDKKLGVLEAAEQGIRGYEQLKKTGSNPPRVSINRGLLDEIDRQRRIASGELVEPEPAQHVDPAPASPGSPGAEGAMKVFRFGAAEVAGDDVEGDEDLPEHTEHDDSQRVAFAEQYQGLSQRKGSDGGKYKAGRRKTVSSEVIHMENIDDYTPPRFEKPEEDSVWIREQVKDEFLFEHLEDHELDQLCGAFQVRECKAGDRLFLEGEEGDTFYLVQHGEGKVTEDEEFVEAVGPGWKRGEEDLMYGHEAYQTVTITSESAKVFGLQREPYRYTVTKASIKKRAMYGEFLSKISFLSEMTGFEKMQVADALKSMTFQEGEHLISFGDEGTAFFIIVEGEVKVIGRDGDSADDPKKEVCEFQVGDCVGELEFVHGHRCVADVIAKTPVVRVAKMGKRHFEKVMGACEDILKERAQEDPRFAYYRKTGKATAD